MNIAYVRVSTLEQNEERQRVALESYGIEKWYTEKVSAKDTNRPKLQELLDFCREGDTVYIMDYSRIARSTKDLLDLIDFFSKKKVQLVSHKEKLDTSTPTGVFMITVIGAVNELERNIILERQREGIAIAKAHNKYKSVHVPQERWAAEYNRYQRREITKTQLAKALGVSRPTLYKLIEERTQKES